MPLNVDIDYSPQLKGGFVAQWICSVARSGTKFPKGNSVFSGHARLCVSVLGYCSRFAENRKYLGCPK